MRLWHQDLIPYLDRQHLLGQHRECCALRGKGWGKKHATVDYVFDHSYLLLYSYHCYVMDCMIDRRYHVDVSWYQANYRGKNLPLDDIITGGKKFRFRDELLPIYPEHDRAYLLECIDLLKKKNAPIDFERLEKELNIKGEK